MLSKKSQYFHVFLLLSFSGNPVFTRSKFLLMAYGIFIFLKYFLVNQKKVKFLNNDVLKFIFSIIFIFVLQYFTLGFLSVLASLNYLFKILIGAFIIYIVGTNFRKLYFEIMVFLSVVSLFFFILNSIGLEIPSIYNAGRNRSIILYNQLITADGVLLKRNSGMFWEPGVFSGYLIITFLLYINDLRLFFILNKRKVLILLLALVTTFSTTGYLLIFLIVLYYLISKSKHKIVSYLFIPLIFGSSYFIYTEVEFLQSKIEEQFEVSQDRDIKNEFYSDRGSAFLFDLYYIEKHPIIGNGMHSKTRYSDHQFLLKDEDTQLFGHGNGFSNFLASMGIPLFLFYFFLYYKRNPFSSMDKMFSILIITGLLQSEQYLNFPLFLILPFVHYNYNNISK